MPFPTAPDIYPIKDQSAADLEAYAEAFTCPCGSAPARCRSPDPAGYWIVDSASGSLSAERVVVATGPFQVPMILRSPRPHPRVTQMHSCECRNPKQLPDGPVLVVGGGNSACQIA